MVVNSREVSLEAIRHLRKSPYASIRAVSCESEHGAVLLRGQVHCYYHKQLAQEAVLRIEGIARVVNEIEVVDLPIGGQPIRAKYGECEDGNIARRTCKSM